MDKNSSDQDFHPPVSIRKRLRNRFSKSSDRSNTLQREIVQPPSGHSPADSLMTTGMTTSQDVERDMMANCDLQPPNGNSSSASKKLTAITSVPPLPSSERRVVLIGCTGHGKGSLGNFLYNLGQPSLDRRPPMFGVSGGPDPHTQSPYCQLMKIQNSPNQLDVRKTILFNILDTPGLNDIGREKDLNHMIHVLEMIGKRFHSVHTLVLVYRFMTRMDAAIMPALRYYRELFAPLFRAHNVILVLTHVSSDDYDYEMTNGSWDGTVKSHLDGLNKILELETSEWDCPIDQSRCFFVNSKWIPRKVEEFLEKITTNEDFYTNDLLYRSYLMREMILDHISEASEITLDAHLIPLPYLLETERTNALRIIKGRIKELLNTVFIENELRASHLTQIDELHTELTDIKACMEWCENEVMKLSGIKKTPAKSVYGDNWIKFRHVGVHSIDAPCNSTSPCGGCECKLEKHQHNTSRSEVLPIEGNTYCVKVKPDLLNFKKKEDHYWFYRFWLEYDGEKHNESQIRRYRMEHLEYKAKHNYLTQRLSQKVKDLENCEQKLAAHCLNHESLTKDKELLQPKLFKIEGIHRVLACMTKVMRSADEVSSPIRIGSDPAPMRNVQRNEHRSQKEVQDESKKFASDNEHTD